LAEGLICRSSRCRILIPSKPNNCTSPSKNTPLAPHTSKTTKTASPMLKIKPINSQTHTSKQMNKYKMT
jgi:hypothetical protein